jgi:acetyl esterase/lipase
VPNNADSCKDKFTSSVIIPIHRIESPERRAKDPEDGMKGSLSVLILSLLPLVALSLHGEASIEAYDITYRTVGGRALQMDILGPLPAGLPKPAIVFLCGNGWGYEKAYSREQFLYAMDLAAERGYVSATVDYSSTMENGNRRAMGKFPAQVHDVKSAIRFLRANAGAYDIDPGRIAVVGFSSGGNLALMLGLTTPADGLEGDGDYPGRSSAVQAVVNLSGATDLAKWNLEPYVSAYLGGSLKERPELFAKASPATYARPGTPPVLTIHGGLDRVVPPEQAAAFDARMKEAGSHHELIVKPGLGHDFELDQSVWDFLAKALGGKASGK